MGGQLDLPEGESLASLTEVAPLPDLPPAPAGAVTVTDRPRRLDTPRDAMERAWGHYHGYHRPLKATLTEILGDRPSRLDIATDRSRAAVDLPVTFTGGDKACDEIVRAVTAKLARADFQPQWHLHGRDPHVTFTRVWPPPPLVTLDSLADDGRTVLEHIQAAQWHELIWGLGQRNAVVSTSVDTESPHTGLSQPSGAGKSIDARSSLAQMLHHGALGIVLDVKLFSHRWAAGLPSVAYCKTPAQIHNMLMWLAGDEDGRVSEISRRNQVADAAADIEGRVHANVGPPIIVIVEELNTTQRMLDRYYKKELRQRGDPARSPASDALDIGLFIGRQVKVFYYLICQRGSVKAVSGAGGGGDARDNIGVWAMYDPSPATFRMIGWDHDVPAAAGHIGRKQIVTAQWVKESQNIYMTGAEARRLAISGTRAMARDDMPYIGDVPNVPSDDDPAIEAAQEQDSGEMGQPAPPPGITIDEAVAEGIFGDRKAGAVKKQILRDSNAPSPLKSGYRGGPAHRYDEDALRAFAAKEMGVTVRD